MTTTAADQTQTQRGAGSGEKATATRSRNIVDWPPEPKTHEEHVDELEQQAQDAADFNTELNNAQVEANKKIAPLLANPQGDPEKAEEESREASKASIFDPEKRKAALKGEMDARAKRDRAQAAAASGAK